MGGALDWQRLAQAVTDRRNELGLTQGGVYAAGGPSVATMRLIEGALQDSYRGTILGRLERALRWDPGSVKAVLAGGEPTIASDTTPQPEPVRDEAEELILNSPVLTDTQKKWMLERYHRRLADLQRQATDDVRGQIELLQQAGG